MASLSQFAGDVPGALLAEFLRGHGLELPEHIREANAPDKAKWIENCLRHAGAGKLAALMAEVADINEMAGDHGSLAISQALGTIPEELPSARARALWLKLNNRPAWANAENVLYANTHRGKRNWTAFQGVAGVDLAGNEAECEALRERLRVILDSENVAIEMFPRSSHMPGAGSGDDADDDNAVQIMVYSEDRPHSEHAFEGPELTIISRKPVREAALVYDRASGIVECVARERKMRDRIVSAFAQTMLAAPSSFEPVPMRHYTLEPLRRRMALALEPADRIEAASVTMLTLVPFGNAEASITLRRSRDSKEDIWELADSLLGQGALEMDYSITQAEIVIRHRAGGSGRARSLAIRITPPMRSNLREQTDLEASISQTCMPRWGLVVQ